MPKKGWGSSILTVGECGYHRGSLKRAWMNAKQGSIIRRPVCIEIGLGVNYLGIIFKRVIIRVTQQPFIQVTYRFKYQSSFVRALTWYIVHSYRRNQLLNNQWPSPLHFYEFAETLWSFIIDNPDHSSASCVKLVPKWMIVFVSESIHVTTKWQLIVKKDWDEHEDVWMMENWKFLCHVRIEKC